MGAFLTVTAKGQITLRRALLEHLGVKPGDQVEIDMTGPGRVELHRPRQGSIDDFIFSVPNRGVSLSIEEMNEIIAEGWSGT